MGRSPAHPRALCEPQDRLPRGEHGLRAYVLFPALLFAAYLLQLARRLLWTAASAPRSRAGALSGKKKKI